MPNQTNPESPQARTRITVLPPVLSVPEFMTSFGLKATNNAIVQIVDGYRTQKVKPYTVRGKRGVVLHTHTSTIDKVWIKGDIVHFQILCKDVEVNQHWLMGKQFAGLKPVKGGPLDTAKAAGHSETAQEEKN